MRIHENTVKGSGYRNIGIQAQVFLRAILTSRHGPIEILLGAQVVPFGSWSTKLGDAFFEKGRAEGNMLSPGDGPIQNRGILHCFREENGLSVQANAAFELKLSRRQLTACG